MTASTQQAVRAAMEVLKAEVERISQAKDDAECRAEAEERLRILFQEMVGIVQDDRIRQHEDNLQLRMENEGLRAENEWLRGQLEGRC